MKDRTEAATRFDKNETRNDLAGIVHRRKINEASYSKTV
jgi:hypothetical protein